MIGRKFAHVHPMPDGSLHACPPLQVAEEAVEEGWAEPHPVARMGLIPANSIMLYAPRDAAGLETVYTLVREAYLFAGGREEE